MPLTDKSSIGTASTRTKAGQLISILTLSTEMEMTVYEAEQHPDDNFE